MTTLDERRARLRAAIKAQGPEAMELLRAAIAGAGEDDRAALAKTLPPSRWFRAEGPTPRACLVLTGLGRPKPIVDAIDAVYHRHRTAFDERADALAPYLFEGLADRDEEFLLAIVERLVDMWWPAEGLRRALVTRIVAERNVLPRSVGYLRVMVADLSGTVDTNQTETGIVGRMAAWPRCRTDSLWHLFETEGIGSNHHLTDFNAAQWDAAIRALADDPATRGRLLDASLGALLRDFSTADVRWYVRVHRLLEPTGSEIAAREAVYRVALQTQPSTAVGLAQDMLARADPASLDAAALVEASAGVLHRTEKKLRKAQLALLAGVVAARPEQASAVSDLVAGVIDDLPADLARQARGLLLPAADAEPVPGETAGTAVAVDPPRSTDPVVRWPEPPPIESGHQLAELLAEQLEGTGDGADLPRLFEAMSVQQAAAMPAALFDRARQVLAGTSDYAGVAPRRHLAAVLLAWAGERAAIADFSGYQRQLVFGADDPVPDGIATQEHTAGSYRLEDGREQLVETWHYRTGSSYLASHSPTALFAQTMKRARLGLKAGRPELARRRPPARSVVAWRRVLATPGGGRWGEDRVLGTGSLPFWVHADPRPLPERPTFDQLALDVAEVAAECTFRAQTAREQDGFDQIAQWAGWLYRDHPDTLAAHAHPLLWTATLVVNVRGVGPVLGALGRSPYLLAGPGYSALALGLSAKTAEHRAQAAEAVADLARRGLLHPGRLAEQLALHLADGLVLAGRVAQALADAATINALAGYRVLQTLAALLPRLAGVNGAARLVELTARLASDYGTPVAVPDVLAGKAKGSSIKAVALRALRDQPPRTTGVALEAAEQARQEDR